MNRREENEYWGICIDRPFKAANAVSYGKLLNEVVRRMVGPYPASLQRLYVVLEMRFKSTGG